MLLVSDGSCKDKTFTWARFYQGRTVILHGSSFLSNNIVKSVNVTLLYSAGSVAEY